MKCFFACALADWQGQLTVVLDSGATVDDLLSQVRVELEQRLATENQGASEASPLDEAWWRSAPVGIFGERCDRSRVLVDGDRVEMYVALKVDPKAARRERAQPHQTEKGRNPLTRKPGR
ncbi:MAG: RnfH family Ubiquitin [Pseudomonadota bacterium]|jgi:putative ubiquitin-RnfH superfamily antitoxin RatB of RatAB toxin-antitoxin module